MGQRAKIHHYVPKVLQRQFTHEGERIWYANKIGGFWTAPELRNISSTFQKKDLYTIMLDGGYSDVVEREYYGEIDNYLGEIVPEVLSAIRANKAPLFRGEALAKLRRCAIAMIRRTPDFSAAIYDNDEARGRMFVEKSIEKYTVDGDPQNRIPILQAELVNPARLRAHGRDLRVRANLLPVGQAEKMFRDFEVRWAHCAERASFILPSVISFRLGNGGSTSLENPRVEVWIPISPKIAMALVRDPFRRIPAVNNIAPPMVRVINEHAMQASTSIASHSQALIESLTGRRVRAAGLRQARTRS